MNNWLILLKMALPFLALFGLAEWLYVKHKVSAEITRKVVHIGTGLLTLLFPVVFTQLWQVVILCASFLGILLLSLRFHFLPSVNAVERSTSGSILFPVIVSIVFAFYLFMQEKTNAYHPYLFFYLPVLIMAIADPVAAFAGGYYKQQQPQVTGKTKAGSIAFLVTAFLVCTILFSGFAYAWTSRLLLYASIIAILTTLAERISSKGWDNFTIPLSAGVLLYLMI